MQATSRFRLGVILGVCALFTVGATTIAQSVCPSDSPAAILDCISVAYAARDTTLYRDLFADDYRFFFGPDSTSWGFDKDFAAAREIFQSATELTIEFPDRAVISPGEAPDTWVLSGVTSLMKFDAPKDGQSQHYEVGVKGQVLRVRLMRDPKPHVVIYRWWQPAE